jgi:CarD family transcriptional regulator
MAFKVGDKVVHPHYGAGQITGIVVQELADGVEPCYMIKIPEQGLTLYVPVETAKELGLRPVMSKTHLRRVLRTLRDEASPLPEDFKERQEQIGEALKTGETIQIAEAVRDLTWHKHHVRVTKRDQDLLDRGRDMLASEMALASDTDISDVSATLDEALAATQEDKDTPK